MRVLGQGGMGRVLLARDVRLGRLVALKILRPDKNARERVLDLLEEARLTAQISHPNVVTIHHVGRHGESPYLALEFIDGPTLRQRMREGELGEREVVRIGAAVASALAAAHACEISHRDLKPENILIGTDGRLRVVDFGIAAVRATIPSAGSGADAEVDVVGTPGYMAPEQWQGQTPTPAIDVWALGVLLYELLAGHRPFEGPRADPRTMQARVLDVGLMPPPLQLELPGLAALIASMLERMPTQRPSAATIHARLEAMLHAPAQAPRSSGPFRGLLAFEESDAAWFFGRNAEVDALVEQLRGVTVLPVVGPSGAGKSSLIRAGLLPRLREQGHWTVLALRPGRRPLDALAARLVAQDTTGRHSLATSGGRDLARAFAAEIGANPRACNVRLHALAESRGGRVLLLIDQLEEVITHASSDAERDAFLDAVAGAADVVDEQVRVIFTVREDFIGQVAARPAMRRVLRDVCVVRRLDAEALREAIALPLARAGGSWDDVALPDDMVAEVAAEPAALPLVQFACATLWERRDRTTSQLRRQDYEAMGGVAGALGRHAETVLGGMTPDAVLAARALLLQLVGSEGARRVVDRDRAAAAAGPEAAAVIEQLTGARLITSRRAHDGHGAHVVLELAHESLSRTWPQLQRWLEESSDERAALGEVEAAAALWDRRGRRDHELWGEADVSDARRRMRELSGELPELAAAFVRASEAAAQRRRKRQRAKWSALATALVVVAVVSLAAAALFREQEREARAREAELRVRNAEIVAKNAEIVARKERERQAALALAEAAYDIGRVQVRLGFLDWDPLQLQANPAAPPAQVGVEVWQVEADNPFEASALRGDPWVRVGPQRIEAGRLVFLLETRSGPAVLRIKRPGCSAADVPLRRMPGYAERIEREKRKEPEPMWDLPVPTCAATIAGTIEIPAGPYIEGGEGEPPLRGPIAPPKERTVDLPTYRIDRTEVPNAKWSLFAAASEVTGVPSAEYPISGPQSVASASRLPAAGIDAHGAEALCRWMGGRLPTSEEWTKAARGGLELADGHKNPMPRRRFPWGPLDLRPDSVRTRANLEGEQDGWLFAHPVDAATGDVSPYGVLAMAGNVDEWTASMEVPGTPTGARIVRGGSWSHPFGRSPHDVVVVNKRVQRFLSLSCGWRCVVVPP